MQQIIHPGPWNLMTVVQHNLITTGALRMRRNYGPASKARPNTRRLFAEFIVLKQFQETTFIFFISKNTTKLCQNAQNCANKCVKIQKISTAGKKLHGRRPLRPHTNASVPSRQIPNKDDHKMFTKLGTNLFN